jgi:chitinase
LFRSFLFRERPGFARLCCALGVSLFLSVAAFSQSLAADASQPPAEEEVGFLQSQGAHPRFEAASKISADAAIALQRQAISSVPHFSGSFPFEGKTFPFTLVGSAPQAGGTTEIPTQLIVASVLLEGFVDQQGEPIVLGPSNILGRLQNSPNFRNAAYATGFTQFADAVQRAQFSRIMAQDWHTLLKPPEVLKQVTIEVPRGMARVYRSRGTGAVYAVVDTAFFISQLNTIVQMADLHPDSLAVILTSNVFLAPNVDVKKCCVLGFHTAFDAGKIGAALQIQTLVWASWIDQGILGTSVADVTPLSHEISEWMNNPFGVNLVPAWQSPAAPGGCQNNLETADPLAMLPNAGFPVNIDGFTYHPQSQVLLSWFTRQAQSDSLDGAFSFPDQGLMTVPSQPCRR